MNLEVKFSLEDAHEVSALKDSIVPSLIGNPMAAVTFGRACEKALSDPYNSECFPVSVRVPPRGLPKLLSYLDTDIKDIESLASRNPQDRRLSERTVNKILDAQTKSGYMKEARTKVADTLGVKQLEE